jgi:hypothetical protein
MLFMISLVAEFEAWIMTLEEQWTPEIAACLQGKFPDWRS